MIPGWDFLLGWESNFKITSIPKMKFYLKGFARLRSGFDAAPSPDACAPHARVVNLRAPQRCTSFRCCALALRSRGPALASRSPGLMKPTAKNEITSLRRTRAHHTHAPGSSLIGGLRSQNKAAVPLPDTSAQRRSRPAHPLPPFPGKREGATALLDIDGGNRRSCERLSPCNS